MSGISIIIVNYNVKYFLEQCLQAVYKSNYTGQLEVFVVDNNSQDGSQQMVRDNFPSVILIDNKDNVGFSKANNQAIKLATQPFTLILNPDTIIQEDCLSHCAQLLTQDKEIGALGVKMVDGTGSYLPESKRGFPTPMSALFKLTGLSKLFKKSAFFNSYYLGHLSAESAHEIEVLTGAFMFMPTTLLQKIGGFDEDYFMYGEDIELSYQVKEQGYKLFYTPQTQIIHFKGESTKKLSKSYLKNFYGAMGIYAQKRNKSGSFVWSFILQVGILISACVAVAKKIASSILRPFLDVILLFGGLKMFQKFWGAYYFNNSSYYQNGKFDLLFLSLIALSVFFYYLFGQYDLRHNLKHLLYGFVFSTLGMLSIYSLLPLDLRFSRTILMVLAFSTPVLLWLSRKLYNGLLSGTWRFDTETAKRIAIVGHAASVQKISEIVQKFSTQSQLIGTIGQEKNASDLGTIADIQSIVESRDINELIFCSSDISTQDIFKSMAEVGNKIAFKVANNDNTSILGSNSKERVGEWYTLDIGFKIAAAFHRRTKRLLDLFFCGLSFLLSPLVLLLSSSRTLILKNWLSVLIGRKTWIGYNPDDQRLGELPSLRTAVFFVENDKLSDQDSLHQAHLWYARNYSTWTELATLWRHCFGMNSKN